MPCFKGTSKHLPTSGVSKAQSSCFTLKARSLSRCIRFLNKKGFEGRICLLPSHHLCRRSRSASLTCTTHRGIAFAHSRRTISVDDRVARSLHVQHTEVSHLHTSVARASIEVPHGHLELLYHTSLHLQDIEGPLAYFRCTCLHRGTPWSLRTL